MEEVADGPPAKARRTTGGSVSAPENHHPTDCGSPLSPRALPVQVGAPTHARMHLCGTAAYRSCRSMCSAESDACAPVQEEFAVAPAGDPDVRRLLQLQCLRYDSRKQAAFSTRQLLLWMQHRLVPASAGDVGPPASPDTDMSEATSAPLHMVSTGNRGFWSLDGWRPVEEGFGGLASAPPDCPHALNLDGGFLGRGDDS